MCQKVNLIGDAIHTANKTISFVIKGENQTDIGKLADLYVSKGSIICADESTAYDGLHAKFDTRRVNHAIEYRSNADVTVAARV